MERLEFIVKGSREEAYRIAFEIGEGYANAYCTCLAGTSGTVCKHRLAIMDGEVSALISGNDSDVIRLKSLLEGTILEAAYADLRAAEKECDAAKHRRELARKVLVKAMYTKAESASLAPPRISRPFKTKPKRTSTGNFDIIFKGGLADGWAFGVPEAFRDKLDIQYEQFVDREQSKELRQRMPKNPDGPPPTVYRTAWVRNEPPMRSFEAGDIFYDPPEARDMVWADALRVLRRSVQVTEARPDEMPGSGWVKVELRYWKGGEIAHTLKHNLSQAEFENLLRTGELPAGHEDEPLMTPVAVGV